MPVDRILAITFTEKAAAELRSRVRERLLAAGERESAREAEAAAISTIHGFCSRLLRAHALEAGLDPDFRVLDEVEAARIALDAFDARARALPRGGCRGGPARPCRRVLARPLRTMVVAVHGRLRSRGERRAAPAAGAGARSGRGSAIGSVRRVAAASRELDGDGKTVDAAREVLERCGAFFAPRFRTARVPDPEDLTALEVKRGNTKAAQDAGLRRARRGVRRVRDASARRAARPRTTRCCASCSSCSTQRYGELKEARSALDFEDLELRGPRPAGHEPRAARDGPSPLRAGDGRRVPGHEPAPERDRST